MMSNQHHCVLAAERRSGEIIVEVMCLESRQSIVLVLNVLPHITVSVIESKMIRWKMIHRLKIVSKIEIVKLIQKASKLRQCTNCILVHCYITYC